MNVVERWYNDESWDNSLHIRYGTMCSCNYPFVINALGQHIDKD